MKRTVLLLVVLLESVVGAVAVRLLRLAGKPRGRDVLVATTGGGNVGDIALLRAAAAGIGRPVDVVVEEPGSFVLPAEAQPGSKIHPIPLAYANGLARIRQFVAVIRLVTRADRTWIVGADVLDGGYNDRMSLMRWSTAFVAAYGGVGCTVLGFSWNEQPTFATRFMARVVARASNLIARDPVSWARLRKQGIKAKSGADIVFGLDLASVGGMPVADLLVNVSGLVGTDRAVVDNYCRILDEAAALGLTAMGVPHVIREGNDDLAALRVVRDEWNGELPILERLPTPEEVQTLARSARFVVTGRMHLGILAARVGCPVDVVATQGKVEGLADLLPGLVHAIDPSEEDFAAGTVSRLRAVGPTGNGVSADLIASVVARSRINFDE